MDYTEYLEHYGVKGMEWGKRKKYPPPFNNILNIRSRSSGWKQIDSPKSDANWKQSQQSKRAKEVQDQLRGTSGSGWKQIDSPKSDANWKQSQQSKRAKEVQDQLRGKSVSASKVSSLPKTVCDFGKSVISKLFGSTAKKKSKF